jgi:dTDP-4-dehydrorhamnose reductase
MNIFITGASGQIGQAYQMMPDFSDNHYFFSTRDELDILDYGKLEDFFSENHIDYAINLAAYTDIERAEDDEAAAYETNCIGARNIATICEAYGAGLIHLSTSTVFDGTKVGPYEESDIPRPLNVYSKTKYAGEKEVIRNCKRHVILRTSLVYSNFSKNFYTNLLEEAQKTSELNVAQDRYSSPTSVNEICRAIDAILKKGINVQNAGVYHFAGKGVTTLKDFAAELFYQSSLPVTVTGVTSDYRVEKALYPQNSYLSSLKFSIRFEYIPPHWKVALTEVVSENRASPIKVGFRSIIDETEYIIVSSDWSKEEVTLLNTVDMKTTITLSYSDVIVQHR